MGKEIMTDPITITSAIDSTFRLSDAVDDLLQATSFDRNDSHHA